MDTGLEVRAIVIGTAAQDAKLGILLKMVEQMDQIIGIRPAIDVAKSDDLADGNSGRLAFQSVVTKARPYDDLDLGGSSSWPYWAGPVQRMISNVLGSIRRAASSQIFNRESSRILPVIWRVSMSKTSERSSLEGKTFRDINNRCRYLKIGQVLEYGFRCRSHTQPRPSSIPDP